MYIEGIMSESDKVKFAELDIALDSKLEADRQALIEKTIKDSEVRRRFTALRENAQIRPRLEQIIRWFNLKMDDVNYCKNKIHLEEHEGVLANYYEYEIIEDDKLVNDCLKISISFRYEAKSEDPLEHRNWPEHMKVSVVVYRGNKELTRQYYHYGAYRDGILEDFFSDLQEYLVELIRNLVNGD